MKCVAAAMALLFAESVIGQDNEREEVAVSNLPADEATRDRIRIVRAAIAAARDATQSLHAEIGYVIEQLETPKHEALPGMSRGALTWFRGTTKYLLRNPAVESQLLICVVRNRDSRADLRRF